MDERGLEERYRAARRDRDLAVLEGLHALKHALRFGADVLDARTPDAGALRELAERLAPDVAERVLALAAPIERGAFARLAPTAPPSGVIALARRPAQDPGRLLRADARPVVLLDAPSHLGNLGAAVRVAAAAGAAGVLATGEHDPWHPAALRGAAGLHFALPVAAVPALPETDRPLVAVDPGGEPLRPGLVPRGAVLAFGSERRGLGPDLLDRCGVRVAIPMRDGVSSLNLATAVAVMLYVGKK